MNKRGLSMIITTLILIVLVLVAVAIIWVVVNNILKSGTEGIALGKFTLDAEIMSASLDNSSNNVSLTVKRNPGKGELSGMKFIFYDGANSEIVTEEDMTLKELGSRRFNFHLININVDNLIRISIVPIFKSESGKEIMGNIIDTYNVGGVSECIANCTDKECGSDGCGGSCGDCVILHGDGWYCQSGTCIEGTNPCQLTSASWNETNVVEGTLVTLNVIGTNCAGIDLNYTIWEDDGILADDFVTSFVATNLSPTWITQWIDDGLGGDPEYYFIVSVVGETEEVTSSDPLLSVTQGCTVTCATAPGCRSSLTNGQIVSGECCGTGDCYDCETGYSWNGSDCVAGCIPETCASLGYECGTHANGTCPGTLNCGTCGSHATCPSGTCVCDSGWGDCNSNNSCDCDLSSNSCVGGICQSVSNLCNDLVLLMHFDEDSTTTTDSSGNGNDGTVLGGTTWTNSGKFGAGAFDFDAILGSRISIPSYSIAESITVAMWITFDGRDLPYYMLYENSMSSYSGLTSEGNSLRITWRNETDSTRAGLVEIDADLDIGQGWNFYTFTYALSGTDFNLSVYKNGTYVDSLTDSGGFNSYPITAIGARTSGSYPHNGTIDEFIVWNRTLTGTEILNLYNSGSALSC